MNIAIAISKYAVLFICIFYAYLKLIKRRLKFGNILDIFIAGAFAVALYYIPVFVRILLPLYILLFAGLYLFLRYRQSLLNTVTTCLVSFGITVFMMVLSLIVSIPFNLIVFNFVDESFKNLIRTIIWLVLQIISMIVLFRIKRFRSGISPQKDEGNFDLLLLASILCIFLFALFYTENIADSPVELIIIVITFCGLSLVVWWRKHITQNYKRHIYSRNEAFYEELISSYEKERSELLKHNDELAKIIHRDNKLIPAMVGAVRQLSEGTQNPEELKSLLTQLEALDAEHRDLIADYLDKSAQLPKTGNISIDAVINFINSKALKSNVHADFEITENCVTLLLEKVSELTDLNTVLCDLGENAIIATKSVESGKILISFEIETDSTPAICFFDNGAQFDEKVIASMGKRKFTTHASDGGSGIGLMTLFEILQKYGISFCLDELPGRADFTKCIQLRFDGLGLKTVKTQRSEVIHACHQRTDIILIT